MNTRKDYIESCLYISSNSTLKDKCYDVYPENQDRDSLVFGILSTLGAAVLLVIYYVDSANKQSK